MNEFIAFFKILFLSKTVLLTPYPINITGEYELIPDKAIVAITPGASIQIDISEYAPGMNIKEKGIVESRRLLKELIPEGSVEAVLHNGGQAVLLDNTSFALSDDGAMLTLYKKNGIPVDVEFNKILIKSNIKLEGVRVYWKNFRK